MKKLYPNSRIEIWDIAYINDVRNMRLGQDKNVDIVQIEYACDDEFIVEVMEKAEKEKTPDIAEIARQVVYGGK